MEKFNIISPKTQLKIHFSSKIYDSYGYDLYRYDGLEIEDRNDFLAYVLSNSNYGLMLRFYNEYDLPLDFFRLEDISHFENIRSYDFVLNFEKSKFLKSIDIDNYGISVYIKGYYYLDIEESMLRQFFDAHKAVIVGFYGSFDEGYFFSPLKGYEEFNPKSWKTLRSHHDIKLFW